MRLNELRDNEGANKKKIRVGRGIGSGKGKTGGRGVKGQKSRSGVAIKGFEGGQMPIHMRLPKRGFNKPNRASYAEINIGGLQKAIDAKQIDAKKAIDEASLVEAGVVRRKTDGIRLLAKGTLKAKVQITVAGASKAAVEAVEKAGGTVTIIDSAPAAKE
tara:strand:- start:1023 stop:1502 length:480 start_codon:yes stop_codon:yes gene_type:complete